MSEENKVLYGQVIFFVKGFGFIKQDQSDVDIFVHYSDISMEGYKTLAKGQLVSYQVGLNRRSQPKAINVIVIK